jgi:hypothetical protein
MKLAKHLATLRKTPNQGYDHTIAICLKVVERYITGEFVPESTLEGLLKDIFALSIECLSIPATRELIYETIRTLTVLLKK